MWHFNFPVQKRTDQQLQVFGTKEVWSAVTGEHTLKYFILQNLNRAYHKLNLLILKDLLDHVHF